jgi:hypothetical protein
MRETGANTIIAVYLTIDEPMERAQWFLK